MSKRQLGEINDESMGESSDESGGEEDIVLKSNGDQKENVDVDFVFTDPCEQNFHSVKQLISNNFLPPTALDTSNLADIIVKQVSIGSMVCCEGETDVFGFITALSLKTYANAPSIRQIHSLVLEKCPKDLKPRLTSILSSKTVGLVLNRRMINLPYQLVPHLHSALQQDIDWAVENSIDPAIKASFNFDYFLILAGVQVDISALKKPAGKKAKAAYAEPTVKSFDNFEEEFLEAVEADLHFTIPTENVLKEGSGFSTELSVMLVSRQKHQGTIANMSLMLAA
ncbi:hypothetical protein DYB25_009785 [Aphanomyces astaci]|uniref:BCCIP family protein n=1 Tax=Aphanomyces astaci TaxID=112090 RepID=A0A396ZU09_APHAT|nr:hypothetical protein DYB25_009785 [Aphanomyces astaci]RHY10058.1 hypothetical protein DYB36_005666 [Aphanomyces astaci]RHY36267.1 hypothetical protein DYB34_003784 [Aphanomyces astaci]RHY51675.1 hypothetical protein DYB38_006014 [Aphanomyces astaci]RHY77115.1 hypothetical protein DYB30_004340 [Aphanomyces astaci]